MEVIAILVSIASSIVTVIGVIVALVYWGASQSETLKTVKEDVSELREKFEKFSETQTPQAVVIAELKQVVEQTVVAVSGLQETIRGDFARRLNTAEMDIREIMTRCKERNHSAA